MKAAKANVRQNGQMMLDTFLFVKLIKHRSTIELKQVYLVLEISLYLETRNLKCCSFSACEGFTVEGSIKGTWGDASIGDVVTITCQENHVLKGTSELTCMTLYLWSSETPKCTIEIGKNHVKSDICREVSESVDGCR